MNTLKYYFDTNIPKAVADQLRDRRVDVVRAEEVGLAEATDAVHLRYAIESGRAIVTHDRDFIDLHFALQQSGEIHSGVFYAPPGLQGDIGRLVNSLALYAEMIAEGAGTIANDIANQYIRLD